MKGLTVMLGDSGTGKTLLAWKVNDGCSPNRPNTLPPSCDRAQ